jgi:bla regulator protein BlaR1
MTVLDFSPVGNHLWQSTLCVAAAWLLSVILRRNRAAVRYWIWFAASLKFLVPFSLLVAIGSRFGWRTFGLAHGPTGSLLWTTMITDVGHPFVTTTTVAQASAAVVSHSVASMPVVLAAIWICGFMVTISLWIRTWMRARAIERLGTHVRLGLPIPALSSSTPIEPGVYGILRPVLLLPEGIMARLTEKQFEAIVEHEMCHVRRRDNLLAAIHMAVEAIFWFYPPVWWIGARMVEERERACDEEVLRRGSEPEVYAEGILNVCKFYVEAPLACASAISGADLKKRIVRVMTGCFADRLSLSRKLLLLAAGMTVLAGPVVFGVANAPRVRAQSQETSARPLPAFEVASIKLDHSGTQSRFFRFNDPSRFTTTNIPAKDLIGFAYHVEPFQISGGPSWIHSDGYDIEAKVDETAVAQLQTLPPEQRMDQYRLMLRSLLADRFKLSLSHETKELPIYALVIAKGGAKLTPTTVDLTRPVTPGNAPPAGPMMMMSLGRLEAKAAPISALAEVLGRQPDLGGRLVVDRTGLQGKYDFTLEFAPDRPEPLLGTGGPPMGIQGPPPPDPNAPSIFTAIQEQLGLKLDSSKGPVEILVINSIEKPTEN